MNYSNNNDKLISSPFPYHKNSKSILRNNNSYRNIHNYNKKNALHSMQILLNNIGNCRYPGISEFQSDNSFQNSSHCLSFSKSSRFNNKTTFSKASDFKFYDIKPRLSNSNSSFTRAKRISLFHKILDNTPSPQEYYIKGICENNISHKKGMVIKNKYNLNKLSKRDPSPGPGDYDIGKNNLSFQNPISIRSRLLFYHEEDLKKRTHCVSMQRYSPNRNIIENKRFNKISFGYVNKNNNSKRKLLCQIPGPGSYDLPRLFDVNLKKKFVLN